MKRPTVASLKRVNTENLERLGAERLAEILVSVAATRPELKRRLRMELAADQGAEHLVLEIDKRLTSLASSKSKVSWRQRPSFVRDLEALRTLISGRLAELDPTGALDRLWLLMGLAPRLSTRVRDKDGQLAAVFERAADDIAAVARGVELDRAARGLVDALASDPARWTEWLETVLQAAPPELAGAALTLLASRADPVSAWLPLIRRLADAAGDVDAYRATYTDQALRSPSAAADVATRLLAAGRIEDAGRLLASSAPAAPGRKLKPFSKPAEPDFDWETAWIDYLEQSGQGDAAQTARWASFERTLSAERARAFTRRLSDFDDVEAEERAFDHAARHADLLLALQFLIDWPALGHAARLIEARTDELSPSAEQAAEWAAKLRQRQPAAAHLLLRKAAAAAFRRRDFATCDRLTREADALAA